MCGIARLFLSAAIASAASSAAAVEITMATSWGNGPHFEVMVHGFVKRVEQLTQGEVRIEPFPAGIIGSAVEVVDTVHQGVAQAGHHWSGYDWTRDKTSVLFGGYAGSLPAEHFVHWLYQGGGIELWQQWRDEEYDVIGFPCGSHSDEVFMHSKKRIQTIDDLRGLRLRTSGAWAEIAQRLGASTVVLPGAQVYPALEGGVVDAIEWANPGINYAVGFHRVAPYVILPGVHQSSSAQECVFNKETWASFTAAQQDLIKAAAKLTLVDVWFGFNDSDVDALQRFKDDGAEIIIVDDAFIRKAEAATRAWEDETAASEGGWFAKVLASQRSFADRWANASLYRSELR
jgi:TRAP-type mannitol/chloroaromatic compound transport system substrate-binding protein